MCCFLQGISKSTVISVHLSQLQCNPSNHISLVPLDPACDLKMAGMRSTNTDQWYTKIHVMVCTENIVI